MTLREFRHYLQNNKFERLAELRESVLPFIEKKYSVPAEQVGSPLEPSDIYQMALTRFYAKTLTEGFEIDGEHSVEAYICRIAHYILKDIFRKDSNRKQLISKYWELQEIGETWRGRELDYKDLLELVKIEMAALPEDYLKVLTLSSRGYSHREIADSIGISEGSSRKRRSRAVDELMKRVNSNPAFRAFDDLSLVQKILNKRSKR